MENHKKEDENMVISFLTLRRSIGILGIALPIILVVGSVIGEMPEIKLRVNEVMPEIQKITKEVNMLTIDQQDFELQTLLYCQNIFYQKH